MLNGKNEVQNKVLVQRREGTLETLEDKMKLEPERQKRINRHKCPLGTLEDYSGNNIPQGNIIFSFAAMIYILNKLL